MKCERCNEPLNEGSGSCPSCGYTKGSIDVKSKERKNNKTIVLVSVLVIFLLMLGADKLVLTRGSKAEKLASENEANFKIAMSNLSDAKVDDIMEEYLSTLPSAQFTEYEASSSLGSAYGPENLQDEDLYTCWCEGISGLGEGQWVKFSNKKEQYVRGILIANGYQKSEKTFYENSLAKKIKIEFSDGTSEEYDLLKGVSPRRETTHIELEMPRFTNYVKITILEGEEGIDDGKSDVCISEIKFD